MRSLLNYVFVITLLAICVRSDDDLQRQWKEWKLKYRMKYSVKDDGERFKIWLRKRKIVEDHNKLFEKGKTTFTMEMNEFAAMTVKEFSKMLMPASDINKLPNREWGVYIPQNYNNSDSVDWRQQNYVTAVKNQGQLGSCYSFSAVEAVEGQYSKQTGNLVSFSEQQIVDCNQGGDGGFPIAVYPYLIKSGGLETEADYPYKGKVQSCQFDDSKVVATLQSYKLVLPLGSEQSLESAVASIGPISVSAITVFESFQLYKSGVYYQPNCNSEAPGFMGYHAMLATGYDTTSGGNEYWMVKNSWGTRWGESGYIRMSRNRRDNCGIADQSSFPVMTANQILTKAGQGGTGFSVQPFTSAIFLAVWITFVLQGV